VSRQYFAEYVTRFKSLFAVAAKTEMFVVAGNHDMGFHYN
jgi:metallophosphoesterase superfamily enzyme